jgi:hypothetical protein
MPISASSRLICCEIADWARNSSSAAFVNERWRATATIVRVCRNSMDPMVRAPCSEVKVAILEAIHHAA